MFEYDCIQIMAILQIAYIRNQFQGFEMFTTREWWSFWCSFQITELEVWGQRVAFQREKDSKLLFCSNREEILDQIFNKRLQ